MEVGELGNRVREGGARFREGGKNGGFEGEWTDWRRRMEGWEDNGGIEGRLYRDRRRRIEI